jgi:hypothetical protein
MSRADMLKEAADHFYALADLFQQLASDTATASVSAARPAAATPAAAPASTPEGHLEICPKHHVPYSPGNFGPYCKEFTDDEAWGKRKPDGKVFCRITPANAAEYLRIKAAA